MVEEWGKDDVVISESELWGQNDQVVSPTAVAEPPLLTGKQVPEEYKRLGVTQYRPTTIQTPQPIMPIEQPQFVARPEPRAIAKSFGQAKEYLRQKLGWFEPPLPERPGGKVYREEHPIKTAVALGARPVISRISGRGLYAPDILGKLITGDNTLTDTVDRLTGFVPTPKEKSQASIIGYLGAFKTMGALLGMIAPMAKATTMADRLGRAAQLGMGVETAKQASELINGNEDYRGATAILTTGVIMVGLGLAGEGVGAVWNKLFPTERLATLKALGLQNEKNLTIDKIRHAASQKAAKFHPDKIAGMETQFKAIMTSRDKLIADIGKNVIFKGQKPPIPQQRGILITGEQLPLAGQQPSVAGEPAGVPTQARITPPAPLPVAVKPPAPIGQVTPAPPPVIQRPAIEAAERAKVEPIVVGEAAIAPETRLPPVAPSGVAAIEAGGKEAARPQIVKTEPAERKSLVKLYEQYSSEELQQKSDVLAKEKWAIENETINGIDYKRTPQPEEVPRLQRIYDELGAIEEITSKRFAPVIESQIALPAEKQAWEMTKEEFGKGAINLWGGRRGKRVADRASDVQHARIIRNAVQQGKPVPRAVLEEYKGEKWADEALAKQVAGAPAEIPAKGEVPAPTPETQPIVKPEIVPVEEVRVWKIKLSKDVPNFKKAASPSTGIIEGQQLEGKYERLATAPILVWERKNGDMEVVTGRHRLDLARRTGEKTIPAQVVKESEGFTKAMALTADAESNIRDGQGGIKDYAQYFRNSPEITEESARERGLLSRAKGEAGFRIGKDAVDDVYAAFLAGKIPDAKAAAIATGAPNNEPAQLAAAAKVESMSPDELEQYARILTRTTPSDKLKPRQGNLFGYDESALLEAEAVAKEVAKEQRSIKERILAVKGALQRPEIARKMGLEFSDEPSIRREVERLTQRLDNLTRTSTTPALWREMKQRAGLEVPEDLESREIEQIYVDVVPPTDVPTKVKLQVAVEQAIDADMQKVKATKRKYKGVKDEQQLYEKDFKDKTELFIHPENPIPEMRAAWTIAMQGKGLFGGTVTDISSLPEENEKIRKAIEGPPRGQNAGFDRLTPLIAEEAINNAKSAVMGATQIVKNIPKMAKFYTGRAAAVIEKSYGETGKELANDTREIAFQSDRHFAKQWSDAKSVLDKLSHKERIKVYTDGVFGFRPKDPKLAQAYDEMLEIMDRDMFAAANTGFKRLLGGEWNEIEGSGKWGAQVLNAEGQLRMKQIAQAGLGNPQAKALAEQMVDEGKAKTEDEALAKMLDWYNRRTRGTHGYFERPRTWSPPHKWLELDPEKVLPALLEKNAAMIEAAKVWGVELSKEVTVTEKPIGLWGQPVPTEESTVKFVRAKALIAKIQQEYGTADAEALKKWVRTNFGLSNDLPNFISDTINALNHYETIIRLGFRIPSALRNLTQGDVNLFTAPLSAHLKANAVVLFRKWSNAAARLYEEAGRSGAVKGQKEMAEVEKGPTGEPQTPKLSMKMFGVAEESNHYRAALIGRFSAESHIRDLAKMKEGAALRRILTHIKYLSLRPEGYLTDMIKNKTFTNPITDVEVDAIWKGEKTFNLDDYERIMHRASIDTQFQQNLATRSIPWRTNPFLRLGMKFKTFGINQMRLIYEDVAKEALKGTFAPLAKYLLFSVMAGELWNLIRDSLVGGDQSLTYTMVNRPEKRDLKTISYKLANDFFDGAGVGILSDLAYGVGNFVLGPIGQTGKNIAEWASNLKHPWMATVKLAKKEFAVSRDIEGLMARADKIFLNSNNRFFEYKRWRDRSFEWRNQQKYPTAIQQIGRGIKEALIGRPKYPTILPYEYAARQITFGDVDDAADYLADQILNDPRNDKELRQSMETSMRNYSPFGNIAAKDIGVFLKTFTLEDRVRGRKLQSDWIQDYERAIKKAFEKTKLERRRQKKEQTK